MLFSEDRKGEKKENHCPQETQEKKAFLPKKENYKKSGRR